MTPARLQPWSAQAWELSRRQHGVIERSQLRSLGLSDEAIRHRMATGRLHPIGRGVYAVGRPEVTPQGGLMAVVLGCGPGALASHRSAAWLWGLISGPPAPEVVVPYEIARQRAGARVHRRKALECADRHFIEGLPVTDLASTFVDLASCAPKWQVERAINEADRLDLIDPEELRAAVERLPRRPGRGRLRRLLGGSPLTDTGLERRFLGLVRSAGLPDPETQVWVNGYRVDFYWPSLALVIETDGWRYHRTPAEQAGDQRRDQTHAVAGLTTLRIAEDQIRYEPNRVKATLVSVVERLTKAR